MRTSSLKLYAPFLALALVQAAFIGFAPSKGPGNTLTAGAFDPNAPASGFTAGGDATAEGGTIGVDPATGQPLDPAATGTDQAAGGTDPAAGGADPAAGGGDPAAGGGGDPAAGGGDAGGGGEAAPAQGAGGMDTSICKGEFQFDKLHSNPPCVGKWTGGDNGGATYQGVTDKEILVVGFASEPNAAVNAVLAPQGLAQSEEETDAYAKAAIKFINENYELYGRKIRYERVVGNCPTTPPDVPACKEAARAVTKMKPFMVVWATPLYAEVFDEWARAGIVGVGGWHFDASYFNQRRPYRYDAFMDGTQSADFIAEFYCKNLAKKKASHSGRIIHPQIGARGQVDRRLGISVPEIPANVATAKRVQQKVKECSGVEPIIATYQSDINRANEQAQATTEKYIASKVTTIACMCDPIAPAFGTKYFTRNGYFPEILMPGIGLTDYDALGRLYDANQMRHAFGISHLAQPIDHSDSDASRVWRAAGNSGDACKSCGLNWAYFNFAASLIQSAGPNLNPITMERAVLTGKPRYGTPTVPLVKFGPNDYTALSDVRLARWDPAARSGIDGNPGSFVGLDGGKRYALGQIPNVMDKIPVAPE